jgi:hypothetical protein
MAAGLEAISVGRAKLLVAVPGGVGSGIEVLTPPQVFLIPGSVFSHASLQRL